MTFTRYDQGQLAMDEIWNEIWVQVIVKHKIVVTIIWDMLKMVRVKERFDT